MHKGELLEILRQLDVHPSRKLGQNFLIDDNCLSALVRAAAPCAGENVLEVGPGTGVLTQRILAAGCRLTSIEFDHRLAGFIQKRYGSNPAFTLIEGDACKVDLAALFPPPQPWRCIANLPYSCASVLMAKMAELPNPPQAMHVLLQREMAERLAATTGTSDYGVLTVKLAFSYHAKIVRIVPPGVFFPPPEVASAFLELRRKEVVPPPQVAERAGKIAAVAFGQRRKQSRRILDKAFPGNDFGALFTQLGLPVEARAEMISPEQYCRLAEATLNC